MHHIINTGLSWDHFSSTPNCSINHGKRLSGHKREISLGNAAAVPALSQRRTLTVSAERISDSCALQQ